MTRFTFILPILFLLCNSCSIDNSGESGSTSNAATKPPIESVELDLAEANRLAQLPLECITQAFPYKSGIVIAKAEDLALPQVHHPAFYGCFDWHSAVHGHWSLIYLLKTFPELEDRERIISLIDQNLTFQNIKKEVEYFNLNGQTRSFERTYGWAWLLKLAEELATWDDPKGNEWRENLEPLVAYISASYIDYLPKLVYPIRVGEHSNTAFGLSFAYDFAVQTEDEELLKSIRRAAMRLYSVDEDCPISWEPSGYDFLSPCLQELDIMRKVMNEEEFNSWSQAFLPELFDNSLMLEPGKVVDRSDGKLVHLDGLNFSRAWCLYSLKNCESCRWKGDEHMLYSLSKMVDGDYAGQHWLASFALYAFKCQNEPR